jgi:predicted amidohydrolase
MGDRRPCSDTKTGEKRVLFSGPRSGKPGEVFNFKGVRLTVGLCYDEAEIGDNLLVALLKQGAASYVSPEEPKTLPKKVEKSRKRLLDDLRGKNKPSEEMGSSEESVPE